MGTSKPWTAKEIEILEELYKNRNNVKILYAYKDVLDRPYMALLTKAAQLGLNKKYPLEEAIKARKAAEEKYYGEYSYDNSQKLNR